MLESGGILGGVIVFVVIVVLILMFIGGYLALSRFCVDVLKKKTVSYLKFVIVFILFFLLFFVCKGFDVYFFVFKFFGVVVVIILWGILFLLLVKFLWKREGVFIEI